MIGQFLFVNTFLGITGYQSVTSTHYDHCESGRYESMFSGATDVILVRDSNGSLFSTPLYFQMGKLSNFLSFFKSRFGHEVSIIINGHLTPTKMTITNSGSGCFSRKDFSNSWTTEELSLISSFLRDEDINYGFYSIPTFGIEIPFRLFVYNQNDQFILSDVDGTITTSDLSGQILPRFGISKAKEGVVELFHKIANNGYHFIYLTARPLDDSSGTKYYLFKSLRNENQLSLPLGPLMMNPASVGEALNQIMTHSEVFTKIKTIESILKLFEKFKRPIIAAYGNQDTDIQAYSFHNISNIYFVKENGDLVKFQSKEDSSYLRQISLISSLYPKL